MIKMQDPFNHSLLFLRLTQFKKNTSYRKNGHDMKSLVKLKLLMEFYVKLSATVRSAFSYTFYSILLILVYVKIRLHSAAVCPSGTFYYSRIMEF